MSGRLLADGEHAGPAAFVVLGEVMGGLRFNPSIAATFRLSDFPGGRVECACGMNDDRHRAELFPTRPSAAFSDFNGVSNRQSAKYTSTSRESGSFAGVSA